MSASKVFRILVAFSVIALGPAAAQPRVTGRLSVSPAANATLALNIDRRALNRSFRGLSEHTWRALRGASLASLSAPSAPPQAMFVSPAAECQFTITKTYNPLPPPAGAAFTITTRIENTGAACNQPNGVYFYDYQSQTNITATSDYTPVNLTQTPSAYFFLVEPNPGGMNQSTTYLNPWRVDVFQFAGSIPAGWVFQFERQLMAVEAPAAPNAVEWPNSPPIVYSCVFGAHQLNFDIGAPSSATNPGGYDYRQCAVGQVTVCVPMSSVPDLDAWWRFDGTLTDSVFSNTVSAGGFSSGYVGQARDTVSGQVADHPAIDLGRGDFTIDFWINVSSTSGIAHSVFEKRVGLGYGATGYQVVTWASVSTVLFAFQMADASGSTTFNNNGGRLGWNFVAISVDRDNPNGLVFYVRPGAPDFGEANILTFNPTAVDENMDNSAPLQFFGSSGVTGAVDELEIFDRALTVSQLDTLYNAHHSGKCR